MLTTPERNDLIDPDSNFDLNLDRCKYFTIDEFNSNFSNDDGTYLLLNQNIQSFNAKKHLLEAFLEAISLPFHTIVLTETWNEKKYLNLCNIVNFSAVHTYRDRPEGNTRGAVGGGVSVFTNSSMYAIIKIDTLSVCNTTIETCVAKIYRKDDISIEHFIVGVYRPHTDTEENFINALQDILSNQLLHDKTVIIAGDMNINLLDCNNNCVNEYTCMLNSLNYTQTINKATRFPNAGNSLYNPSCLDHISLNKFTPYVAPIYFADISDHCGSALYFKMSEKPPPTNKKHKISFRLFNDQNASNFETIISQTNWNFLTRFSDVNEQFSAFQDYINSIYRDCFPLKTKYISDKRKNKPWITESTMNKIKMKSNYYKQFKNGIISKEENNRLKNRLNKEINQDKKTYYQSLFSNSVGNMKKSWKTLHSLLGTCDSKNSAEKIFGEVTSDPEKFDIVNKFNDFFAGIGDALATQMPDSTYPPTFPSDHMHHNFYLFPPTHDEISKIIMNLKMTWTSTDVLPVKLLKRFKNILVVPITLLIEHSIQKGVFPSELKIARITPIHKEGLFTEPSNFRPISSLSYWSKIYEKFFSCRLMKFCNKFSLISSKQFGFQRGVSTSDALMSLTDDMYSALNEKVHFLATIIDVKKAFDCVNHNILLNKLQTYGVRGVPLNWLASYLANRKCYVQLDSFKSRLNTFNIGVPQGSILGPLLFLIYVNNLTKFSNTMQTQLFADDTIVFNTGPDIDALIDSTNSELIKLKNWTQANKLTIHAGKTKLLIVSNRLPSNATPSIRILDNEIAQSNCCKYLGVQIDRRLSFKDHIRYINGKISRHTGILYKIRDNLPMKSRLDYYYAYMYPYFSYNIIIWGSTFPTHLQPLIIQQKRTIRTLTNAGYRDHTDPLFKRLKILKLEDIYYFHLGTYMFHAHTREEYAPQSYILTRGVSQGDIRSARHRLTTPQHSVSYFGPKFWNSLTPALRSITSYKRFRKSLKEHLLNQYQDN